MVVAPLRADYSSTDPSEEKLARRFRDDAALLRDALAKAISANHPERSIEISEAEFRTCRRFLRKFENIYTLNYDLLLYWALMQNDIDSSRIKCDDGFRQAAAGIEEEYVEWTIDIQTQNVFYLHGALHIFDGGTEIQKYTWSNTGIALVDQIRQALEENRYPVYVAEGSSQSKWERVLHNSFLVRGYRSLSTLGNSLVIFGHSLSENDEHVLRCIERSRINQVFVSIFGDVDNADNQRIVKRAHEMSERRGQHNVQLLKASPRSRPPKLQVHFFDAVSAKVWE